MNGKSRVLGKRRSRPRLIGSDGDAKNVAACLLSVGAGTADPGTIAHPFRDGNMLKVTRRQGDPFAGPPAPEAEQMLDGTAPDRLLYRNLPSDRQRRRRIGGRACRGFTGARAFRLLLYAEHPWLRKRRGAGFSYSVAPVADADRLPADTAAREAAHPRRGDHA